MNGVKFLLRKGFCFFLALGLLFSAMSVNVFAAVEVCPHNLRTFGDHVMNGGVGQYGNYRRYYYINSGFNNWYTGWIRTGIDEWVHTSSGVGVTTSISVYETGTKSDAMFEFENSEGLGAFTFGLTQFYLYQDKILDEEIGTRNWGWCKMLIHCSLMDSYMFTNSAGQWGHLQNYQKKAICMHEMGHAMGLSHNTSSVYNLMYPYGDFCQATRATADECRLINHIYG